MKKNIIFLTLLIGLGSCQPKIVQHGNIVTDDKLAYLKPGHHTKSDVIEFLGPPSSIGLMDSSSWYYIGMSGDQYAFFKPEIDQEKNIKLTFDASNTLSNIRTYSAQDKLEITPSNQTTESQGHDISILEQVFGNFGRRYQREKK